MSDENIEWTTDMTFPVGNGGTIEDVAKFIEDSFNQSQDFEALFTELCSKFLLDEGDAELAIDRALGGIVRALTTNPDNEPDATEDPVANYMFHEVWKTLPESSDEANIKILGGKWYDWDQKRKT